MFFPQTLPTDYLTPLQRSWQCATIQLDFQQPINFSLEYQTSEGVHKEQAKLDGAEPAAAAAPAPEAAADDKKDGKDKKKPLLVKKPLAPGCARPVMIHRAMAGSIERFTAILAEHFAGKWPFWLSPRQVIVIPVGMGFLGYAKEVAQKLKKQHFHVGMYPLNPIISLPFQHSLTPKQMSTAAATPSRRRSAAASWRSVSQPPYL